MVSEVYSSSQLDMGYQIDMQVSEIKFCFKCSTDVSTITKVIIY